MSDDCFNFIKDLPEDFFDGTSNARDTYDRLKNTIIGDDDDKQAILKTLADDIKKDKDKEVSQAKIDNWVQKINTHNLAEGTDKGINWQVLIGKITGVYGKHKGRRFSADAQQKSMVGYTFSKFTCLDNGGMGEPLTKFYNKIGGTEHEEELAESLSGNEGENENVNKIGRILKPLLKHLADLQNRHGAEFGELEDYRVTQTHNVEKMMKPKDSFGQSISERFRLVAEGKKNGMTVRDAADYATKQMYIEARDKWKTYTLGQMDQERTFREVVKNSTEKMTPQKMDSIMNHIYDVIVKGKLSKTYDTHANLAQRISQNRVIHFKDGKNWIEYNKKYGHGTINKSIEHTLEKNSMNYINLKNFGKDPDKTFHDAKAIIADRHKDDPNIAQKLNRADKYFATVMGYDKIPHSYLGAKISANIRAMQNITKLAGVMLISLSDHAQALSALRSNGVSVIDRYSFAFQNYLNPLAIKDRKIMGDILGITSQHSLGTFISSIVAADTPMAKLASFQNLLFKANGQVAFDNALRGGFATGLSRNLAKNLSKEYAYWDKNLKHTLGGYGIGEEEVNLMKANKHATKNIDGRMFVTPDMFKESTDESLRSYLQKEDISDEDRDGVARDMQERLSTYLMDQTDHAQMRMGASERAMIYRGTSPGTVWGEMARFFGQFKFYGLAVTRRSLGRMIKEEDGASLAGGISHYMAAALAFGYVSHASQSLVKYGQIPNPKNMDTYYDSLIEGGGLGMFGSLLMGQYDHYGKSLTKDLAGPTFGTADDLGALISSMYDFDNKGRKTSWHGRMTKQAIHFTDSHIMPGLLVTHNAVMSHFYHSLLHSMNPALVEQAKKKKNDNIQIIPN